jgi:hypothetical protein
MPHVTNCRARYVRDFFPRTRSSVPTAQRATASTGIYDRGAMDSDIALLKGPPVALALQKRGKKSRIRSARARLRRPQTSRFFSSARLSTPMTSVRRPTMLTWCVPCSVLRCAGTGPADVRAILGASSDCFEIGIVGAVVDTIRR